MACGGVASHPQRGSGAFTSCSSCSHCVSEAAESGLDVMYMYSSSRRQPSGREAPAGTQALPSHPPPEVQAARGLRRCLAHPCHLPPLQPAGAVRACAPDPLACFTRVGAELSCELLMVHQEGQELNRQQHAGQRCLWAQALRQHPEHALEPKTQGPRKT